VSHRFPHVLHLIDHMGSGGAQRVILDLLEAREPAANASVVSLRSHCLPELRKRIDACGARYFELGLSRRNPLGLHRIRRVLQSTGAEIVHSHLEVSNEFGVLAARSLGRARPAVIVHLHNYPDRHYSAIHRWAGRWAASRADAVVVPSTGVAASARASFGRKLGRVEIIPYGIDPSWIDSGRCPASEEFRQGDVPVIGTVARLVPQKSLHDLIGAMPRVLEVLPSARLLICGDGPLRADLEALCRRLGVAGAVTFAGYTREIRAAYAAMDVFVLASSHEGLPISMLEVMAMGIPVVGTRVPGIADLIEDGQTGLSVPYGDPSALAAALIRLFADDALRERVRKNACRNIERVYTRDIVAQRMEALYTDLCSMIPRASRA